MLLFTSLFEVVCMLRDSAFHDMIDFFLFWHNLRFGRSTNLTVVKDNDLRLSMGDGDESDHHDPDCPERKVDIIFFCADSCSGDDGCVLKLVL